MAVDYNSVPRQCLSAGHINNYWQNSSCQIKLTDSRWGVASHTYNPAYPRPHLIIPKSLLNIKQTPFITAYSPTTGCIHHQKCQREGLFTLSIGCVDVASSPLGVPLTEDTFPVGSTENLSWRYKKVHIATTNKDLFTLFNGLLLIKGWSLTMDEMKPETQTKCHFLRYIKEAILFPFTKAWFWFWGLLICLNVFHIFVIVEAPRFPMKAGFCH